MKKLGASFAKSGASITTSQLARFAPGWIPDSERRQLSAQTLAARRLLVEKLLWFLKEKGYVECGVPELRALLAHISKGRREPGGRRGNERRKPVRPRTLSTYYGNLPTLFGFLIAEGAMEDSPCRADQCPTGPTRPDPAVSPGAGGRSPPGGAAIPPSEAQRSDHPALAGYRDARLGAVRPSGQGHGSGPFGRG